MKKKVKRTIRRAKRNVRAWRSRHTIDRLLAHESYKLRAIGLALREALDYTVTREERRLLSLIEKRRATLLRSPESIPVIDYGAGSPDSNRTEEEMRRGVRSVLPISRICEASKPEFWALFLFKLLRMLKPDSCLELGTSVGISASYQATALRLNKKGRLVTLEGSPEIARIAEETLAGLGLDNTRVVVGPFHETYEKALESAKPIDFLFNDGHHDHDALLHYFAVSLKYLAKDAVMVFDDISWSPGMKRAWAEIENDSRVAVTIDLRTIGVAVMSDEATSQLRVSIPL